jgi:galactoside O-acetyltransferase
MRLRFYIYKLKLGGLGDGSLFDIGVNLVGVKNLYVGKKSWIDSYVCISAYLGTIQIGDNCHVGSHVVMGSREPIIIGNRVGIGAGAKIYSNTEKIQIDKFLAGPMIPEELKGYFSKKVVIEDDVLIGANAVILPGVIIGRGAVIGANAIITDSVEPWSVVIDRGKKIYHRPPLSDNTIRNFDDNH